MPFSVFSLRFQSLKTSSFQKGKEIGGRRRRKRKEKKYIAFHFKHQHSSTLSGLALQQPERAQPNSHTHRDSTDKVSCWAQHTHVSFTLPSTFHTWFLAGAPAVPT